MPMRGPLLNIHSWFGNEPLDRTNDSVHYPVVIGLLLLANLAAVHLTQKIGRAK